MSKNFDVYLISFFTWVLEVFYSLNFIQWKITGFQQHSKELRNWYFLMTVDLDLLDILMDSQKIQSAKFHLSINNKDYLLENVSIINSPTPVNSPTTRGGVYFSDKFAYKLKGSISDLSIIPFLTKTMLGPSTEFGEIKITASINQINEIIDIFIFANLTNSVQTPSKIELNMIIVKLERD